MRILTIIFSFLLYTGQAISEPRPNHATEAALLQLHSDFGGGTRDCHSQVSSAVGVDFIFLHFFNT